MGEDREPAESKPEKKIKDPQDERNELHLREQPSDIEILDLKAKKPEGIELSDDTGRTGNNQEVAQLQDQPVALKEN